MSDNQLNPLVNGIAVIIDDEVDEKNTNIGDLISQIESEGMPCVKLRELPVSDDKFIAHLHGVSFILLDWTLWSKVASDDNKIPRVNIPVDSFENANVKFLQKVRDTLFVPVFIFTDGDVSAIKNKLTEEELYNKDDHPNFIFIKSKNELKGGSLFKEISNWIRKTPPIYVLKTWEHEYRDAQSRLFADFYKFHPSWVTVLKKCFKDDSLPMPAVSIEIMSLIRDNLSSRMRMSGLEEDCLGKDINSSDGKQIRQILEHSRFVGNDKLPEEEVRCGDIFLQVDTENGIERYFINIRPDCDCIARKDKIGKVELHLLKGIIVSEENLGFDEAIRKLQTEPDRKKQNEILEKFYNSFVREEYGHFYEKANEVIIPFMYQGNTFSFRFRDIIVKSFSELADNRIGRLLPPFLTHVRTRYAQYLLRQGLPRIPPEAISEE
jgi:hypothetical protein